MSRCCEEYREGGEGESAKKEEGRKRREKKRTRKVRGRGGTGRGKEEERKGCKWRGRENVGSNSDSTCSTWYYAF